MAVAAPFSTTLRAAGEGQDVETAVESAHTELWRRFVDPHNIVLDYTDLDGSYARPTPEECRLGKPNALGWWTPVENGAMFNGLYLDALVNRALQTKDPTDLAKARRLAEGLLLLASVGEVKGFIARGLATDGKTTYAMGSNDQTAPWFYGLWRYAQSGLPEPAFRQRIVDKISEAADLLRGTGWRVPAAPPFHFRGSFAGISWDDAPRLLFLMKALHDITGSSEWSRLYRQSLRDVTGDRLEACALGVASRPKPRMWTGSVSVACLRALWDMEDDQDLREFFLRGLVASADFAAGQLGMHRQFENESDSHFEGDWRKLNAFWREQKSVDDATSIAAEQLAWKNRHSPRRLEECRLVREPAFAAWIVSLCPDQEVVSRHRAALHDTLAYYRYDGLRYSQFFPVECAWWRLRV